MDLGIRGFKEPQWLLHFPFFIEFPLWTYLVRVFFVWTKFSERDAENQEVLPFEIQYPLTRTFWCGRWNFCLGGNPWGWPKDKLWIPQRSTFIKFLTSIHWTLLGSNVTGFTQSKLYGSNLYELIFFFFFSEILFYLVNPFNRSCRKLSKVFSKTISKKKCPSFVFF